MKIYLDSSVLNLINRILVFTLAKSRITSGSEKLKEHFSKKLCFLGPKPILGPLIRTDPHFFWPADPAPHFENGRIKIRLH